MHVYAAGAQDSSEEKGSLLEEERTYVSAQLFNLTDEVDALFNDTRSIEQRMDDWIRLGIEAKFRSTDAIRFRQSVAAGFNLQQISNSLRLIFDAENGDAYDNDDRLEDIPQNDDIIRQTNRDGGSGALRYFILKEPLYQLTADTGIRVSGGVNPFGRIRGNIWLHIDEKWSIEPSQAFFVEREEGFGERTRIDINRLLTKRSFLRIRNEGFWSEESRGLEFLNEVSYASKIGEYETLSFPISFVSYSSPDVKLDVARISMRVRGPIISRWLYLVLEPGIDFPEERDYRRTPFISLRLDALFDRKKGSLAPQ